MGVQLALQHSSLRNTHFTQEQMRASAVPDWLFFLRTSRMTLRTSGQVRSNCSRVTLPTKPRAPVKQTPQLLAGG